MRPADFNTYGSRRGNHEVMMRGTFANIRIKNEMVPGVEGGMTKLHPDGRSACRSTTRRCGTSRRRHCRWSSSAGKEYGTGSSRDWAAKGTLLLGVKAVIVESFERIHRSNLVGMGVLPLQFRDGGQPPEPEADRQGRRSTSSAPRGPEPAHGDRRCRSPRRRHVAREPVICRIDTLDEVEYYRNGGILQYVLRSMIKQAA